MMIAYKELFTKTFNLKVAVAQDLIYAFIPGLDQTLNRLGQSPFKLAFKV